MHENAQKSVCLKIAQHAISRTHISQTIISICEGLKATKKKSYFRVEKKNQFGDWLANGQVGDSSLRGEILVAKKAPFLADRKGELFSDISPFYYLFTTRAGLLSSCVSVARARLTCFECEKKNHGDPKPVFPLGHPHR